MIEKNIKILLLYIFLGLITTIYIFGFDHISFTNTDWFEITRHDSRISLLGNIIKMIFGDFPLVIIRTMEWI